MQETLYDANSELRFTIMSSIAADEVRKHSELGYRDSEDTRIHHNTINGIIQNPKYKGWYCGNKVKIIDYRTREQRFLLESEWVTYKDESDEVVLAIESEKL